MGNTKKKHINLVGSSSSSIAPSKKRRKIAKSKSRSKAGIGSRKQRGSSRSSR